MTTIERIATWASGLRIDDVPDRVLDLLRAQRLSVLGAVSASAGDHATGRVLKGLGIVSEPFERDHPERSIYAGAVMSVALDYDDYMCFGHTGHSSVLVPVLLAAETGAPGPRQLAAQLAANEIGARLGGACLLGPLNGQLWSFIHCAEAALAAGLLLELDERRLAHALAISLYQPARPSVPGFMAPDSKLLTAAEPAVMGLRSARLAAAGVTGPLDVLDHPKGFFRTFSYAPIKGMLGGLGSGWATDTLCVKPYPGCAYVDSIVDALLDLGPPKAEEVERVHVSAGALTCGMDAMSAEYAEGREISPVTINFSVGANVAITLLGGRLTPEEIRPPWIETHAREITELRRRVGLAHDWELTRRGSASFGSVVPTRAVLREVSGRGLARGLRRMRSDHRGVALRLSDSIEMMRWLREQRIRAGTTPRGFWDPSSLEEFRMTLPASVEIELRDGTRLKSSVEVPAGAAGHPERGPAHAAEAKFARWGPDLWGDSGSQEIAAAIAADADDLGELMARASIEPS